MPVQPDSSPKAMFNRFKTRTEGGEVAAFILENDGTLEILEPAKAKLLTPQKLKTRLKGKAVGGYFFKGSSGPIFQVVAGKKGGHAGQPWVKYILRSALSVSNFDIQTAPDADIDEAKTTSDKSTPESSVGKSSPPLGGLDLLDGSSQKDESDDLSLLDGLDDSGTDDSGDLDGLDLLEDEPLLVERDGKKHLQEEWDRIDELAGPEPDDLPDPDEGLADVLRTNQMFSVDDGVNAPMNWEDVSTGELGKAKERLAFERKAARHLRGGLTKSINTRTGTAKKSLEANCDMAVGLAGILTDHPELLGKGGLLNRIVGPVEGQGQHGKDESAEDVSDKIQKAAARLKEGKGTGEDGNLMLQFIGCFTDGLTEVVEGEETPTKQLDAIWPEFCAAFGVEKKDQAAFKKSLLERVENYKAIAGGRSDTLAGKGARKKKTREGINPEDKRLRLTEHDALIKGDVSGSVHSCFLAYELAESLTNPLEMDTEKDVVIKDPKLVNARVLDALSMTAGGRKAPGKIAKEQQDDLVFHTAYEMLNGLRGITGAPALTQDQATTVMEYLWKGKSYTQAMETLFSDTTFPWMSTED